MRIGFWSKIVGVFVLSAAVLGAGVVVFGENVAVPPRTPDQRAVAAWLDRVVKYAASLPEAQLVEVLPALSESLTAADRVEPVERLVARVKDPEKRAQQEYLLCCCLGQAGKYDAAIRKAQSMPNEPRKSSSGEEIHSWRVATLYAVARLQFSAYDFKEGEKTIGLIGDPHTVSHAYLHCAEYQAKAGLYADAEKSLAKVVANTDDERQQTAQPRQMIARYKAVGLKDPPRIKPGHYFEAVRYLSTVFCDPGYSFKDAAQAEIAEKAVDKLKGANDKATAWRNIAWSYYRMRHADKQNIDRCRRAIKKSLEYATKIPDGQGTSYMKAVAFASAADLYVELGDKELAKQAVDKARAVNLDADMLGGLSGFTTTPLLVSVLVRVGDVDGGKAIAEKIQNAAEKKSKTESTAFYEADVAWLAWATSCALEGKIANVERQLEKTGNVRTKAVLSAGVASGLLELQHRRTKAEKR